MQRKERIPLHDHSDGNSGGRIGSSGLQSAVVSTTTTTTTSGGAANLSELGDVNVITTPPADNDSLTYDSASGKWIPEAVTSTVAALDDVGDVNAPTPSDGDVLTWDSTPGEWVAAAPGAGSGSVATDTIWDTKGDLAVGTGSDTASKLAVGTDGYVLTADSSQSTGVKWAAASSGGITVPSIVQYVQSTTAATSVTIAAAASGRSLLLISDSTTGQITSVACTNVTWTQLKTFTSGGGSYYALWVGSVAGGSSGTSVTWTKPGSFATIMVMEITDTLTRTLGASTSGNNNTTLTISPTSGHLVVMGGGSDNTTAVSGAAIGNLVALTTGQGFTTIAVAYATSAGKASGSVGGAAGGGVLCEVT